MTITLDLPQQLERELSGEAAKLGLSLSEYALRLLSRRTSVSTTLSTMAYLHWLIYQLKLKSPLPCGFVRLVPMSGLNLQIRSTSDFSAKWQSSIRTKPKTGTELVAYWQDAGLIGTRTDITDSQKHARTIRVEAERRTRKG